MTRTRKIGLGITALLCALALGFALAACDSAAVETHEYGYGEEGTYYCSVSEDTDYMLTLQKGSMMLTTDSGVSAEGEYDYDGETFSYTLDGSSATGSVTGETVTLSYGGRSYLFLKYEYYTVTFSDGSSTLTTQSVLNGKAAQDPGDATKEGYVFLGWYEDSAFTMRYGFNTAITTDTTIYARFVEIEGTTEYTVTYDFGNGETVTAETLNGKIYDLPEAEMSGYTFLGWWVSATNSASELTYKYDGETLCEDTTLFAVYASGSYIGASVKDGTLTWLSSPASQMSITVTDETGASSAYTVTATSMSYSLPALETGKYTVTVTSGGVTETLTYVSNGLRRVSGYKVVSGSILMYDPVENVERYYITIECGNPTHDHTYIDNGTSLYYDFSSCDMPAEGITFTVYAYADGYYYSVSSYNYFLGLERTEVTVEGSLITWTPVSMAMQYEVYIDGTLVAITYETSFSLANYGTGTYEIEVRPVTTGYYSEKSDAYSFTKTTLASPTITGIEDYTITWTEVEGAAGYKVSINGVETTVDGGSVTSLILSDDNYMEGLDSYEISVKALAQDSSNDSPYSEAITVTGNSVGSAVSYSSNTVTWQYSLSASEYRITVNDGDEIIVTGTNSANITLTKSGNNEITIYFVNGEGDIYGTASITVYAYAIVLDARGGAVYDASGSETETLYVAKGDIVTLPTPEYPSGQADFVGWYTLPDIVIDPDKETYEGDGTLFADGSVFTGNSTVVLYAFWINQRLTIALDPGIGTLTDDDGNAVDSALIPINGNKYALGTPDTGDAEYVFIGWYSGPDGTGTRYTWDDGSACTTFTDVSVSVLYAYWAHVMKFSLTTYDGEEVLSVEKGEDTAEVTEITVPESYTLDGTEYTTRFIGVNAFSDCATVAVMNIPDTITYIDISNNGYDSGYGSFAGTPLTDLNVYETGEPSTTKEITYYSEDGVLFWLNRYTDETELLYYPFARTAETYVIPETVSNTTEYEYSGTSEVPVVRNVTSLATGVFRRHTELTHMELPEYVTSLSSYLFYNCTNLVSVEINADVDEIPSYMCYGCSSLKELDFLDGVKAIGQYAFRGCTSLTEVTIPDTVTEIGAYAFRACTSLRNVTLSSGMTEVTDYLFYECTSLRAIDIPYGITAIGVRAFHECNALATVYLPDSLETIGNYAFYDCFSITTITLPVSLAEIQNCAFQGCYKLAEVCNLSGLEIETGATGNGYVGYYAKNVYTPGEGAQKMYEIDGYRFIDGDDGTHYLMGYYGAETELVLPDGVDGEPYELYDYCLYGLSGIRSITVPAAVADIGDYAFYGCTGLEEFYLDADLGDFKTANYMFAYAGQDTDGIDVYVGADVTSVPAYMFYPTYTTDECAPNIRTLTFAEGSVCESIGERAFQNCSSLTTINIPGTVRSIGDYAFYGCTSLDGINITGTVERIGDYAFYGCTALCDLSLPSGIEYIGTEAFIDTGYYNDEDNWENGLLYIGEYLIRARTSLSGDVEVRYGTTVIAGDAFYNCYRVTGVTLPSTVIAISEYAFYQCTALESVNLPEGLREIGQRAFYGCTSLKEADIPSTATTIGNYTFYGCSSLERASLPDGLETIPAHMFRECSSLKSVTLPSGLTGIGESAFYQCSSLGDVYLPETLTHIDDSAFSGCASMENVVIPDSVETLGYGAFRACSSLRTLTIGKGLKTLGTSSSSTLGCSTFYNCTALREINFNAEEMDDLAEGNRVFYQAGRQEAGIVVNIGASVKKIPSYLFYPYSSSNLKYYPKILSVNFAEGSVCEEIGDYAFYNSNLLSVIELPGSLKFIDSHAFAGCVSLMEMTIPAGVEEIGEGAFDGCTKLIEIENLSSLEITAGASTYGGVAKNAKNVYGEDGSSNLFDENGLTFYGDEDGYFLVGYTGVSTSITLPDYMNGYAYSIYPYAFYYNDMIEYIEFPETLTSIGEYAFYGATSLRSVSVPDSVTEIGEYAFYGCSSLVELSLGSGITEVATYTFAYCTALVRVVIPEGVTRLNNYAFAYCYSLVSVTLPSTLTGSSSFRTGVFRYDYKLVELYNFSGVSISKGSTSGGYAGNYALDIYTDPDAESKIYEEGDFVFYIDEDVNYLLCYTGADKNIVLPEYVKGTEQYELYEYLFYGRDDIVSVVIPDTVSGAVPASAFTDCTGLESVTLSKNITSIGDDAFNGCSSLESVSMDGVVSIGASAFKGCSSLESVDLTDCLEEIGAYAFSGSGLLSVTIPGSVKSLPDGGSSSSNGYGVFGNCESLTEVVFSEGLTYIGSYSFRGCTALEAVVFPETLTEIGQQGFYNCESVTEIVLPDSVTTIGASAFYGCEGVSSLTMGAGLTSLGNTAFRGMYYLETVYYNAVDLTSTPSSASNGAFYYAGRYNDDGVDVYIGADVEAVANSLFYVSSSYYAHIARVYFEDESVCETIGSGAFRECQDLEYIALPDSVTTIDTYAFYNCKALESVYFGSGLSEIGLNAFYNCTALSAVYYNGTEQEWTHVTIGNNNSYVQDADIYYYSEVEPAGDGLYWYWDEDGNVAVW